MCIRQGPQPLVVLLARRVPERHLDLLAIHGNVAHIVVEPENCTV